MIRNVGNGGVGLRVLVARRLEAAVDPQRPIGQPDPVSPGAIGQPADIDHLSVMSRGAYPLQGARHLFEDLTSHRERSIAVADLLDSQHTVSRGGVVG